MRCGQARQRDSTERAIIDALRAVGARVFQVSGPGAPDLAVWFRGRAYLLEVKGPKTTIRPGQAAAGYPIVRSVQEAWRVLELPVELIDTYPRVAT